MKTEILHIAERECICYSTSDERETLLVQLVDEHDMAQMEGELEAICRLSPQPFHLVAVRVSDWQTELTPWTAHAVFGKVPFGDGAAETLRFLSNQLLPSLPARRVLLGGYSLAGLFALWAACNTFLFDGIAAVSPSVWYPQWTDYASSHTLSAQSVYLSLGNKEERTKNPVMAQVGNAIRLQHELLLQQGIQTILEWNEGNHFAEAELRMAKGFAWLMNN